MVRRVAEPVPLVKESFPAIRAIYLLLHEEKSVTYADIGRALGCSGSRVKQIVKGYVPVKSPSGGWTVGKPKEEEEGTVALAGESSGTGEEGSAPTGCLPGAEG